ncbi:CD109 antigen-like [Ornithodoros turicata]|uniref:CD109 antigen-like n=1 Tax=Ornithodoros turicata TaxID=34597 RepID=UPI00313980B9
MYRRAVLAALVACVFGPCAGPWCSGTREEISNDLTDIFLLDRLDLNGTFPRYFVLASKVVRPGQVYRVSVSLLMADFAHTIRTSLLSDGEEVASAKELISPGETSLVLMQVPQSAKPGDYKLRFDGNANDVLGSTVFTDERPVFFQPQFLTILIQTNQLVFNFEQSIKFRVILLTTELKPYTDPVDIYLTDSRGIVMKRWVSQYPYLGFLRLSFDLPYHFAVGWWTIKVVALSQVEEKKILLERWYTERYDVYVSVPPFIVDTDEYLEGDVSANYTTVAPVFGNATIKVFVRPILIQDQSDDVRVFDKYLVDYVNRFRMGYQFKFPMEELRRLAEPYSLRQCEIEVYASVGERFLDVVVDGYARARVVNSTLSLKILGVKPLVFKPGMKFTIRVAVTYHDLVRLSEERLATSNMTIRLSAQTFRGGRYDFLEYSHQPDEKGLLVLNVDPPEDSEKILIRATYKDSEDTVHNEATAVAYYSPKRKYLQISTSTSTGLAGEYAVFHVRSNYYMRSFHYIVLSKGTVLQAGVMKAKGMLKTITTFSVPLSPEMAPAIKVMVFQVSSQGDMATDAVILPVQGINRGGFTLKKHTRQDRTGNVLELNPVYTTESIVGLSGLDSDLVAVQARNDLTPTSVIESLYRMEEHWGQHTRAVWRDRDGKPDEAEYFVTQNFASDDNGTFQFSGLVVATNLNITSFPHMCNESQGQLACVSGQCYPKSAKCNGYKDCDDGTDEGSCEEDELMDKSLLNFYLYRTNRFNNFFDATGGNFAWHDQATGNLVDYYVQCEVPKSPTLYMFNAVSVSKELGFSILTKPIYHNSVRPFYMTYEAPETAVLGEQIGIRILLFNYQNFEVQAELRVLPSEDYRFVQVGPLGRVSAYSPVTTKGEQQHVVFIQPFNHLTIHVPIVSVKKGKVEVKISARTNVALEEATIPITFLADGVAVHTHTSLLMDLRAQAYNIKFMDLNVTEDPIIPFEAQYRRYMFGSPEAHISVMGDVVGAPMEGPILPEQFRFSAALKSGEHSMFSFAYNILTLNYLRLTDQLTKENSKPFFDHLNKEYIYQSGFCKNGAFTMFKREPSVWLTAFCIRMYQYAQFPDWEYIIYIDRKIISDGILFVLRHQNDDGSFYETTSSPWNRRMSSMTLGRDNKYHLKNVTLTAHVLITLTRTSDLTGYIKLKASNARREAVRFLEKELASLEDPYAIAITTYALMEAGSIEAEAGYRILDSMKKDAEGATYWSRVPIPPPTIISQSQRPFLMPRWPHPEDSVAVETTAYALLIYLKQGGFLQDQIVKWLSRMRYSDFGFVGAQDTVVALEALTEYSFRTHVRGITEMHVTVESSSNPGNKAVLYVAPGSLASRKTYEVQPNVWGHCDVLAKGAGLSLVQLDVSYNVDRNFLLIPPANDAFDLTLEAKYSGRNRSHINIKSCAKWKLTRVSPTSGAAVLELDIPTGYMNYRPALDTYVKEGSVPHLRMAKVLPRTAVFMFDHLVSNWTCINFLIQRWYPVANSTRYLKAKVYEYNIPENYKETIWENYDLYVLNICEVCGSYQCPYCPYFSAASSIAANALLVLVVALLCRTVVETFQ